MHAVESLVIHWTHLIHKVLKEDSAELILKGLNPGPSAELHFWTSRRKNIENIYEQVCAAVHLLAHFHWRKEPRRSVNKYFSFTNKETRALAAGRQG